MPPSVTSLPSARVGMAAVSIYHLANTENAMGFIFVVVSGFTLRTSLDSLVRSLAVGSNFIFTTLLCVVAVRVRVSSTNGKRHCE